VELGLIVYGTPAMNRIVFLVDGFNFYHALDHSPSGPHPKRYNKYKWLSLTRTAVNTKDSITFCLFALLPHTL
jgi:hypothetical protein